MRNLAVALLLSALPSACATTKDVQVEESRPLWPAPPDPTRIEFLYSYLRPSDVEPEKNWLDRFLEVILGKEEEVLFKRPIAIHADQRGRIFVAEIGMKGFYMMDPREKRYEVWGRVGPLTVTNPVKITSDDSGNIYIVERNPPRVIMYSSEGAYIKAMGRSGELQKPTGIAYSSYAKRIAVVDTGLHRVALYDPATGKLDKYIGQRGHEADGLNFPTFIAADRSGGYWISDTMNFLAKNYSGDGELKHSFGCNSVAVGCFARMKGIGIDSEGHIYIVDSAFNVVQIFNDRGQLLLFFGGPGRGPGQLYAPTDLDISKDDKIYVLDKLNLRINVYQYVKQPEESTSQVEAVEKTDLVENVPPSEPATLPSNETQPDSTPANQ